jgi:hypothetical protein
MGRRALDSSGSAPKPVETSCEHDNEPSGSTERWDTFE